ncbi:hypothetical protein AAEX28_04845 [Lentisphaerota bacterium WC36G]|nr:hypothetical protein LJT99_07225 [Lentisphaerae bacterium WC36]UDQ99416.1 hypothetical protein LJT99_07705 [Lentisphaerae bacterium WC36]
MCNGYIMTPRSFLSSISASRGIDYLGLMYFLYTSANHTDKYFDGELIKRGQLVIGVAKFAKDISVSRGLSFSRSKVVRMLSNLQKDGFLILKADSKKTVVTICNYDNYNNSEYYKRTTSEQQVNNQQTASEQPTDTIETIKQLNLSNSENFESELQYFEMVIDEKFENDSEITTQLLNWIKKKFANLGQYSRMDFDADLLTVARIPKANRANSIAGSISSNSKVIRDARGFHFPSKNDLNNFSQQKEELKNAKKVGGCYSADF